MPASRNWLERVLARCGLRLRGGWRPTPADALAVLPAGPVAVVWMVGQAGSGCWPYFARSRFHRDGQPDPMDRWSQSIGDAIARRWGGRAVYPSDGPPYAPFQQWARRAEPVQPSTLRLQMHPRFGLWHADRFALLLPDLVPGDLDAVPSAAPPELSELCLRCSGQPCLQACPVDAFTPGAYAVDACAAHLQGLAGDDCMQGGCLARRACPVGVPYRYAPEHAAFHMRAFARSHRPDGS